jgi:two-component system cell cycle sensor histidine kinase/response regulator CckA
MPVDSTFLRGRQWAILLGVLCLPLLATVQAQTVSDNTLQRVTLQLKWKHQFQFAGYYAAIAQGYYRQAGLEVVLREGGPDVDFAAALQSGRAQYAVALPTMLLRRNQGMPVVALAAVFQHSPEALLVPRRSGLNTPHQICGHRVMMSPHDTPAILAMLQNEGVPPDCFDMVEYDFDLDKLIRGAVDAVGVYVTDEPWFYVQRDFPFLLIQPRNYGVDLYGDCLFTSEAEIAQHPKRVEAFREASLRGWKYAMRHIDEIIDLILARYNTRKSRQHLRYEADAMRDLMRADLIEIGHMNPGRWQHIANTYVKLGMLDPDYSLAGFLYDHNPQPDYTWVWWTLGLTGGLALVFGVGTLTLASFNRRLRAAEQAVRASQRMLQMVLDAIPIRVFWKDRDAVYLGCNRAFAEDAGLDSPAAVIGKTDATLSWRDQVASEVHTDRGVIETGQPRLNTEERLHGLDGRLHDFRVSTIPLRDEQDTIIGMLGLYEDITVVKRAEEERLHLLERIQQARKFESLATLAGGMAHHFNNLLQVVIGNVELTMLSTDDTSTARQQLTEALQAAKRAAELSTQMLDYFGRGVLPDERLDLSAVVRDLLPMLRTIAADTITVESHLATSPLLIQADPDQVRQILVNLVTNASEAMEAVGGVLHITTGHQHYDQDDLTRLHGYDRLAPGPYAYMEVSDTGAGMDSTTQGRIFDPFFSTKFTGRGLGLTAVQGIVRGHRGAIAMQSTPGVGTTVRVLFPLQEPPEAGAPPPASVPDVPGEPR